MANSADLVSERQLLKKKKKKKKIVSEVRQQHRDLTRDLFISSLNIADHKRAVYKGRAVNHAYYGI